MLSSKTSKVLAVFMAVSTTVAFASWMAQDVDIPAEQETGPQTLLDDEGREYTLTQNADGTETATYEDGRSVTVKREENGSLRYISGAEGLIAGLAAVGTPVQAHDAHAPCTRITTLFRLRQYALR